jgi:hypothetical protein
MVNRSLIGIFLLTAASISIGAGRAQAFDESKYPNFKGQWNRVIVPGVPGPPSLDQTKGGGARQGAPLTPEYQKVFEASLADQRNGGQGHFTGIGCQSFGMPMMMTIFQPGEFLITPETFHIVINNSDHSRRVFTDGRDWPTDLEPTYQGYSIGQWIDEDGDGKYDVLEAETRGPFKGPRSYDATGLPLHHDNQSVFKERFFLDKGNPNILHNVITVIDHALTRPWTVDKRYERNTAAYPVWPEYICAESNQHVQVGKEGYFISADGYLMPSRKDQPPPDLRYFKQATKK